MCFRPATASKPYECTNCGKKINYVLGALPKKCPYCGTETKPSEETKQSEEK